MMKICFNYYFLIDVIIILKNFFLRYWLEKYSKSLLGNIRINTKKLNFIRKNE